MLIAGVLIRFFDTVLRAYCTFDTVEASVMIATHVRDRKLVLTSAMSCVAPLSGLQLNYSLGVQYVLHADKTQERPEM